MDDLATVLVASSNLEQRRAWDGDEGGYWAANSERFDEGVAAYHDRLLDAAGIGADARVLDIGCGSGQTTRDAARRAPAGRALGVDLSSSMLAIARRLAEREGLGNVVFEEADAQVHPFPDGSFDVAISRTGCMFFGEPVAAFANIRRALRAGGRLTMVAWQPISQNEWISEIVGALAAGRDLPLPPPEAPGPFALSDPDRVRQLLTAAGFEEPELEDIHAPMYFGADVDDAHRFVVGLQGWMLQGLDEAARRHALDDLHDRMQRHQTDRGVEYGSAMWLITSMRQA